MSIVLKIYLFELFKNHIEYLQVGLKPAGGIKSAQDVLQWITLIKEELGDDWLTKDLFRIGASSVLDNIVKTVETLKP